MILSRKLYNLQVMVIKKNAQIKKLHQAIISAFKKNANPLRAIEQQRYMKSTLPFYGLPAPEVKRIINGELKNFPISNNLEYRKIIQYFFSQTKKREEWYAGLYIALKYKDFITKSNLNFYLNLILITQWWDIVDAVAINLVGKVMFFNHKFKQILNSWIKHKNMWIRRTAILCQLKYKLNTNQDLLYKLILMSAKEEEFFIRKAIGWALREYSKTNPKSVKKFIKKNSSKLSSLSIREGMRRIKELRN